MAKSMTLQEAIDKAPDWATHISVSKFNGEPEFYNKFTKDGWYSRDINQSMSGMPKAIEEDFCARELLAGTNTTWYLEEIAFSGLEND